MAPTLPGSFPNWVRPLWVTCASIALGLSCLCFALGVAWWGGLERAGWLALLGALLGVFFTLMCASFESLLEFLGWCGKIGAMLGSIGGALSMGLYLFYLFRARHNTDLSQEMTIIAFSSVYLTLLGWLPGLILGFCLGGVFSGLCGWLWAPLFYVKRFPVCDGAHWALMRSGIWLGVVGLCSIWLLSHSWLFLLGLGVFFLGLGLFLTGWWPLCVRAAWLGRVLQGREPMWYIVASTPRHKKLPRLSSTYGNRDRLLVFYRPSADGPYRQSIQETPVALY